MKERVLVFKSHSTKCWGLLLMEIPSVYLSVCGSVIISSPVIGQTVQKLVCHWLGMAAMFRSRIKFWGVGGKMLFTVQACTNWFRQIKLIWAGIKTIY